MLKSPQINQAIKVQSTPKTALTTATFREVVMAAENPTKPSQLRGNADWRTKAAATRLGITLGEYKSNIANALKWCSGCKKWQPRAGFGRDKTRHDGLTAACTVSKNAKERKSYQRVPDEKRKPMGPPPLFPRDGDKKQARQRINVQVRTKKRPHPNSLPCLDCGHVWKQGERRHEYDHFLGYASEHHYDVEPVCTTCHTAREWQRGTFNQSTIEKRRSTAQRKEGSDGKQYPH